MHTSRYIIHIDGDAFFASCEIAMNHSLKDKPVVVGRDRGIATAMNTLAKKKGIVRGLPIFQVKNLCPECVVLPGNYTAYTIFSARMVSIAQRYSAQVEAYSIDECFVDVTSCVGSLEEAEALAKELQYTLSIETGITFSLGLAPTKTLAKIASKWNKPNGFAVITEHTRVHFLESHQVGEVWGVGPRLSHRLTGLGIKSAYDFAQKSSEWIKEHTPHKHERGLWHELRGEPVLSVAVERDMQSSMQAFKSFPATKNETDVTAYMAQNIERIAGRLRAEGLYATHATFYVRNKEQQRRVAETTFTLPTASVGVLLCAWRGSCKKLIVPSVRYTQVGLSLRGLTPYGMGEDLFALHKEEGVWGRVYNAIDVLAQTYGAGVVSVATSHNYSATQKGLPKTSFARGVAFGAGVHKRSFTMPYLGEVC